MCCIVAWTNDQRMQELNNGNEACQKYYRKKFSGSNREWGCNEGDLRSVRYIGLNRLGIKSEKIERQYTELSYVLFFNFFLSPFVLLNKIKNTFFT